MSEDENFTGHIICDISYAAMHPLYLPNCNFSIVNLAKIDFLC